MCKITINKKYFTTNRVLKTAGFIKYYSVFYLSIRFMPIVPFISIFNIVLYNCLLIITDLPIVKYNSCFARVIVIVFLLTLVIELFQ